MSCIMSGRGILKKKVGGTTSPHPFLVSPLSFPLLITCNISQVFLLTSSFKTRLFCSRFCLTAKSGTEILGLRLGNFSGVAGSSLGCGLDVTSSFCSSRQSLAVDRCSEPRVGERVPYVIVYGTPGQPLIQLVRRPEDVAGNPSLRLNGVYYITKQILPTLDRAFSLMGVDVRQW